VQMKTYESATIAGLARPDGWSPIRRELGIQGFGVNAWTAAEPGAAVIPEHDEVPSGHEELYLVVAGRATFDVGGEEIDVPTGTVVFVRDPAVKRSAVAAEAGTIVLAVGARPGDAYRPRSWETNADLLPLWEEGRHEEVKRTILEVLDRYEDRGPMLYNLACAEAQLGETDAALEHLAAAVAEAPRLAGNAREDSDLDPIRNDSRFPA
jgi:quercetin dioxygenase-like cupin family protein